MVGLRIPQKKAAGPIAAPSSDYGSDLDEDTANELLSQVEYYIHPTVILNQDLEQDPVVQDAPPTLQRTVLLKRSIEQSEDPTATFFTTTPSEEIRGPKIEVEYSEVNRSTFSRMCALLPRSQCRLTRLTPSALQQNQVHKKQQRARLAMLLPKRPNSLDRIHARLLSASARGNHSA
jgi:hypothetical protein